jgi:hypothetical protein
MLKVFAFILAYKLVRKGAITLYGMLFESDPHNVVQAVRNSVFHDSDVAVRIEALTGNVDSGFIDH